MSKKTRYLLVIFLLISLYSIGPRVDTPTFDHSEPQITLSLEAMEDSINQSEFYTKGIKEDNEARIIWFDSTEKKKTPVAIVYLHGFTASQEEGNPVHKMIAERYGCNLYLARLNYHGIASENELKFMTPEGLYDDAKQAIAIGKKLGDEVIVMSTSTGGTLALYYAAYHDDLKGLINYSPNIRIKQKSSYLLDKPWGLQLARLTYQGKYKIDECDAYDEKYWNCKTRLEAVIELQALVDHTMTEETFSRIKTPTFVGGYYKDAKDQDNTVSIKAMVWMFDLLGTPNSHKRGIPFPEAKTHVIANSNKSNDWKGVYRESCKFAEEVLNLKPLTQ